MNAPMTGIEDALRRHPQVRRLLSHSQWRYAAEAAIEYACHGTPPHNPRFKGTSTWKQIEDVHRRLTTEDIPLESAEELGRDRKVRFQVQPFDQEAFLRQIGPPPPALRKMVRVYGITGVRNTRSSKRNIYGYYYIPRWKYRV